MALLNKEAQAGGVAVDVAAREALVGHVEEREEPPLLDHVADLLPLRQLRGEGERGRGGVRETTYYLNYNTVYKNDAIKENDARKFFRYFSKILFLNAIWENDHYFL